MSNYLKAINNKNFGYDSDVKYFLIKLLQVFDLDEKINIPFATLQVELGVTARVIRKGLDLLCENEVLVRQHNTGMQKKQVNCYVFGGKFKDDMLRTEEVKCQHKLKIEELLNPDKSSHKTVNNSGNKVHSGKLENKKHPLGLSSRLLLIVMLYHASSEGVVRLLGVAELAVLAGQSEVAVKENIKRLKAKGYIRCSVGGVPKNLVFDKTYSYYFLNLAYIKSSSVVRSIVILDPRMRLPESTRILRCARNPKEIKSIDGESVSFDCGCTMNRWSITDLKRVLHLFKVGYKQRLDEYLQLRLHEYASSLLSDDWCKLDKNFISVNVQERIRLDITHHEEGGSSDTSIAFLLCKFIYDVSLNLALFARRNMLNIATCEKVNFSLMRHLIIPQAHIKGFSCGFVVESFYSTEGTGDESSTIYLYKGRKGFSDLSTEELISFNLISM